MSKKITAAVEAAEVINYFAVGVLHLQSTCVLQADQQRRDTHMDDKELAEKVNAILADILAEASCIAAESEDIITMNEAIQQAVHNLANDPDGTLH